MILRACSVRLVPLLALMVALGSAFAPPRRLLSAPKISSSWRRHASSFDEESYEQDRLTKDAQAMDAMKIKAEEEFSNLRTPWKWVIRKRTWDLMEAKNIARFPRPVHHRIPNFDGAEAAAERLSKLEEFVAAKCIKVNPDTPQRPVRHAVLDTGQDALDAATPTPNWLLLDYIHGYTITRHCD